MALSLIFGVASTNANNSLYGVKSFGSLLREYLTKYQCTEQFYNSHIVSIQLVCQKYIVSKVCESIGLTQDTTDNILGVLALSVLESLENCYFANATSNVGLLESLSIKIPTQCIEGILIPNTVFEALESLNGVGNPYSEYPSIYADYLPKYSMYEKVVTQFSSTMFGRKIPEFSSFISLRDRSGGIINNYNIVSSKYICVRVNPFFVGTFNNVEFDDGDGCLYSHRVSWITKEVKWRPDLEATMSSEFFNAFGSGHYWPANFDGSPISRYNTNAFSFELYVSHTKETKSSNLCALDLASTSFIFYSTKASYHFPDDYSVGSTFIANNTVIKATGLNSKESIIASNLPPDDTLLDTKRFNIIYSLISKNNFIEDIPKHRSLTKDNKLFTDGSKANTNDIYNTYLNSPNRAIETIKSGIYSHPNGSIAAYTLPPYGFLKDATEIPNMKGDYSNSMTIDYIKAFYKDGFIYTTHKDEFNKAFKQSRGYDEYTDNESELKYGGFCSSGCWYDFNLRTNGDFDY